MAAMTRKDRAKNGSNHSKKRLLTPIAVYVDRLPPSIVAVVPVPASVLTLLSFAAEALALAITAIMPSRG